MTWRRTRDKDGPLVVWKEKIAPNKYLRFAFSVNDDKVHNESIIMAHLIVHPRFRRREAWNPAGEPLGVSGLAVWARIADIWDEGLDAALKMTRKPYVEVQIEAETPRLMHIYRNRLERRGYTYHECRDPYLYKVLRGA